MQSPYITPVEPIGVESRLPLLRWFAASATLAIPQAAVPVAFSLLVLSFNGQTSGSAAMILAMTLAQVVGAAPIARLCRRCPTTTALRLLVAFRSLAFLAVALCAQVQLPFAWLVALAALAGSANGAAYGYLRPLLNHLVPVAQLPRSLGIAATLNEVTFVLAPVIASGLGALSPVAALMAMAALGALPALLVPSVGQVEAEAGHRVSTSILNGPILLWLSCAAAEGATVGAIEIGAVALALEYDYPAVLAILFTVPLCLASIAGGVWISMRNAVASRRAVSLQLALLTLGSALAAFGPSIVTTVLGIILMGCVLAPLGTYFSLALDKISPPHRKPEVFALLRSANAVGVIIASALLTATSLGTALATMTGLMLMATLAVITAPAAWCCHQAA